MKWVKTNRDTFYINKKINRFSRYIILSDINYLINKSNQSKENKSRLCLHKNLDSKIHQMMIFHKKNHLVRPHKHLSTDESYLIIKGKMKVVFFNNNGKVEKTVLLSSDLKSNPFYIQIPKNTFHNQIFLKDTIFLEIKNGPFRKKNDVYLNVS